MNIDRLNQNLASGAYGRRANRAGDASAAAGASSSEHGRGAEAARADGVQLSDQGRAIARAEAAVRAAPEVREALVAELRQQVQSGSYRTKDEQVAQRLIDGQA